MTPAIIAQAYKDAGVTTTKDIIAGIQLAIVRVEDRITDAYNHHPTAQAHEVTKQDRILLKAQLNFLEHLEGRR